MAEGMVVRGLRRVRTLLADGGAARSLEGKQLVRIRDLLHECASGIGGEVSARQRAGRLAETYLRLNDEGRASFLRIVATEFGPNPELVAKAHADYQAAIGSDAQWTAESALRNAMRSLACAS
jgi:malonyl-CoA decarboxylase